MKKTDGLKKESKEWKTTLKETGFKGDPMKAVPVRMQSEPDFTMRKFEIDFNEVKTLEDVILILKGLNISWRQNNSVLSEAWQVLIEKRILK